MDEKEWVDSYALMGRIVQEDPTSDNDGSVEDHWMKLWESWILEERKRNSIRNYSKWWTITFVIINFKVFLLFNFYVIILGFFFFFFVLFFFWEFIIIYLFV